jgi:hypothetical protein
MPLLPPGTIANVADYNAFAASVAASVPAPAALGTTWAAVAAWATNGGAGGWDGVAIANGSNLFPLFAVSGILTVPAAPAVPALPRSRGRCSRAASARSR